MIYKILIIMLIASAAKSEVLEFSFVEGTQFTIFCDKPTNFIGGEKITSSVKLNLYNLKFNPLVWVKKATSDSCEFDLNQFFEQGSKFFYVSAEVNGVESEPSQIAIIEVISKPDAVILFPGGCIAK